MGRSKGLLGARFGRLVVVEKGTRPRWKCLCDCGGQKEIDGSSLRSGKTRSCGCLQRESRVGGYFRTHGYWATPTYNSWHAMLARCLRQTCKDYARYGARGITVCDRWRKFEAFLADMGERPSLDHSLDRYPNNRGNYEPGNCRWASPIEQANNRTANRNRWSKINGGV